MPFKLKLKKSRQYNVASKNIFVISVELLDNTTVECTLSSQSLGKECLGNLCQRLGLHQPDFFGLKFLSKHGSLWWIDLERPLKKQLDRYSQEPYATQLKLGVMFFVADATLLQDEVTRYHYFLQLKTDIIEGHLRCTAKQAVLLAAYSLQAEFGAHDSERHTTEYLTNFAILPKAMTMNKIAMETLMEQVILAHQSLQALAPSVAEMHYIKEAQQLEGYGQQIFSTKDHSGAVLYIGASLEGVFVKPGQGCFQQQNSCSFRWQDIVNLVHHRRYFGIECHQTERSLQCHLEDVSVAKYVWKMCAQQHRFYSSQQFSTKSFKETMNPSMHVKPSVFSESTSDEPGHMLASQDSLDELGVYHTEEYSLERLQSPLSPDEIYLNMNHQSPSQTIPMQINPLHHSLLTLSQRKRLQQTQLQQKAATLQHLPHYSQASNSVPNLRQPEVQPPVEENRFSQISSSDMVPHTISMSANLTSASNPVLNGSAAELAYNQVHSSSMGYLDSREMALPIYRQAPDYETAIKHKYGVHSSSLGDVSVISRQCFRTESASVADNKQSGFMSGRMPQLYTHYKNYIDLTHIDSSNSLAETGNGNGVPQHHPGYSNLMMPPTQTYSTPELHSQGPSGDRLADQLLASLQMNAYYQYKSPPPYPLSGPQRPCTSTPDLTNTITNKSTISPDLVSRKNLPNENYVLSTSSLNKQETTSQGMQPERVINNNNNANIRHTVEPRTSTIPTPSPATLPVNLQHVNNSAHNGGTVIQQATYAGPPSQDSVQLRQSPSMGPMLVAAMNGLTLSPPDVIGSPENKLPNTRDNRISMLEAHLQEGLFFIEFEQIPKRKPMADFRTALEPDNLPRNRFKDVLPYEENRIRLTPNKENRTGYINASHLTVSVGNNQRFYIAAQGPLPNTVHAFWQMVWEHHISLIVMLTETEEQGCEKCFPYWPQQDHSEMQINEFQVSRSFSVSSSTYVTCSLVLSHASSRTQRSVWHIQYTDWPDHRCPQDLQGFLSFMEEIDAVRRLALNEQPPGRARNAPVLVHCSAGVGRSGVVVLCDIMLYSLDHGNEIDLAKILTHLRYQRMLTIQTLAQYKFVYLVLIQYLKNSRLI